MRKHHLLLLCPVAFVAGACSHDSAASPTASVPIPPGEAWLTPQQISDSGIKDASATVSLVSSTVVAGGKVTFDDLRVTHVFSPVTGRVTRVIAMPGDHVAKDAPLLIISSPDLDSAASDLAKAKADLDAAQLDYKREKELYEGDAASQRDFEAAENTWKRAVAEYDRARKKEMLFQSGSVNPATQEYTLRSPIEGDVVMRNVNPGVEVQGQYSGGTGVELYTIGKTDEVWVTADVYEVDLAKVHKGAHVTVRVVAYPDQALNGQIDWVSEVMDPATRTVKIRCSLANPDGKLKPEMYATVSIDVPGEQRLAVPRDAILRLGDQTVVFVNAGPSANGRVRFTRRQVIVDEESNSETVPVTDGLKPGERVAVSGAVLLSGMI